MCKRGISLMLVLILLLSFSISVVAHDVMPRYLFTESIYCTLSISGNKATCLSEVTGYMNEATKIEITQVLKREISEGNWEEVETWIKSENGYFNLVVNTKSGLTSGTYRVETISRVYSGTSFEQTTAYSNEVTF